MASLHSGPRAPTGASWAAWFDGFHRARVQAPSRASVLRAKHLIDRRFQEPVPLDVLAAEARLSKYHFIRAFRDALRETPHRYLVARRVARARELLEGTDLPVTDICFEVGFESLGSFIVRFRRLVGDSPGRYRRRFARGGPVDGRAMPACLAGPRSGPDAPCPPPSVP